MTTVAVFDITNCIKEQIVGFLDPSMFDVTFYQEKSALIDVMKNRSVDLCITHMYSLQSVEEDKAFFRDCHLSGTLVLLALESECVKSAYNYIKYVDATLFLPINKALFLFELDHLLLRKVELLQESLITIEHLKMEAIEEMISMIAHQWRQPLNAMGSSIAKVEIDITLDELNTHSLSNSCEDMKFQIAYLSDTIDQFRSYFTPSTTLQETTLAAIIHSAIEMTSDALAQNRVMLFVDEPLDNHNITLYVNEVTQAIVHIINNALDEFIESNSASATIHIATYHKNNKVYLSIEDSAGGINSETIHKIFEPYFSTKKKKNGTGLGLYMVKNIIERHSNGTIEVENGKKGAKFILGFPTTLK